MPHAHTTSTEISHPPLFFHKRLAISNHHRQWDLKLDINSQIPSYPLCEESFGRRTLCLFGPTGTAHQLWWGGSVVVLLPLLRPSSGMLPRKQKGRAGKSTQPGNRTLEGGPAKPLSACARRWRSAEPSANHNTNPQIKMGPRGTFSSS